MYYRISVRPAGVAGTDRANTGIVHDAASLGIALAGVRTSTLYFVQGAISPQHVDVLCATLFADPVTETATWETVAVPPDPGPRWLPPWVVEVGLHPGVTDPVANQIVACCGHARHAPSPGSHRYDVSSSTGDLDEATVRLIARRLLCNPDHPELLPRPHDPGLSATCSTPSHPATSMSHWQV